MRFLLPFAALCAGFLVGGCATPTGTMPLTQHRYASECARADTLLVMLPGLRDQARDLVDNGLVPLATASGPGIDVVTVDAHLGYYRDRTLIDRLSADVIEPAKARGYTSIWLAGISLGGLGSLLYSQSRPQDVDRLLLLAPYLGPPSTADLVTEAGGLADWRAAASRMLVHEERAWGWLSAVARQDPDTPELFLGYGEFDRYARNHALVAEAMSPDRVVSTGGGHDWETWAELWRQLDRRQAFRGSSCD